MGRTELLSVDQYIALQSAPMQDALHRVRGAIRKALPYAEERISYNMPSYVLRGGGVIHFAGWKRHYSLYFASEGVVAAFKDELSPYAVKKGTISFTLSEPVPEELIERLVRFRAGEIG